MANEKAWAVQLNNSRQQSYVEEAKKEKGDDPGFIEETLQEPSKKALKWAWRSVVGTFGISLFYICFHFIGRYIGGPLSSFFCRMGEEGAFGILPEQEKIKSITGGLKGVPISGKKAEKIEKTYSVGSELAEIIVAGALTLIFLLIFLWFFAIICFVGYVLEETTGAFSLLGIPEPIHLILRLMN